MNSDLQASVQGLRETINSLIFSLQRAQSLKDEPSPNLEYISYRSACLDRFQLILNHSENLMKHLLTLHGVSRNALSRMYYNAVFENACTQGLLSRNFVDSWLEFREARNVAAHNYGEESSERVLSLCSSMIMHAEELAGLFEAELFQ